MTQPTLVALSSGSVPSGVAVIRLTGPQSFAAVAALAGGLPRPRQASLRTLKDPANGQPLDQGLVIVFPAPHSFTGLDCAELQVHGSPAGVKAILSVLTAFEGVRLAGAGDFTRLAFENGKLDLTEVEGLGDLLAAETESQRRQALTRFDGALSRRVGDWRQALLDFLAEIEARLDFSDEDDVPFELPAHFKADIESLENQLADALARYDSGRIVREGFRIALAGAPNAGKSSLLNALAGSDVAIVTSEAGTTRDTKDVTIDLGGMLVIVTDTAGLRETDSLAEQEGIVRARRAIGHADLVLWLEAPDVETIPRPQGIDTPIWTVSSKTDIGAAAPDSDFALSMKDKDSISVLLSKLEDHIKTRIRANEPGLISHLRDKAALEAAAENLHQAIAHIGIPELCAEDLRQASDQLAELIGLIDTEHVLDRLFAGFCIGK